MENPIKIKLENIQFTIKEEPIEFEDQTEDLDIEFCVKAASVEVGSKIGRNKRKKCSGNCKILGLKRPCYICILENLSSPRPKSLENETVHNCGDCNFSTLDEKILDKHKLIHLDEAPRSCRFCTYVTTSKTAFEEHIQRHSAHGKMNIMTSCGICSFKCEDLETLENHQTEHLVEVVFACKLCDFQDRDKELVVKHALLEHGLKCQFCDYRASTQMILQVHMKIHGEEEIGTRKCKEKYDRIEKLDREWKIVKEPKKQKCKKYFCAACGFLTTNLKALQQHKRNCC